MSVQAVAYCNWGRWVADCPRPDCSSAEHAGDEGGAVGGLTGLAFHCSHCGLVCSASWPANVDDIERILAQRPVPSTRNWRPGETLHDLMAENIAHGVIPAAALDPAHPDGLILAIAGDMITTGRALLPSRRIALGG